MHILHINSQSDANKVEHFVQNGSDVFILIYMEGCGPCNATRPEWAKLESALKEQYAKNDKLVVIDINKDFISNSKHIGTIDGFPTIKYICDNGKTVETYENSSITKKDRSVNSFINWIETKINNPISTTSSPQHLFKRLTNNKHLNKKKHSNNKHLKTRRHKTKKYIVHKGGKKRRGAKKTKRR
jgi:thiol-disulfide isomerase/thioredoxin